jgi:hypothetical protein
VTPQTERAAPFYEILSRLDLKPGRYNLRFATERASDGKTGSVYTDIVVPDFAKAPLSMSGVALEAVPGVVPGAKEVAAPILPVLQPHAASLRQPTESRHSSASTRAEKGAGRLDPCGESDRQS